MFEFAAALVLLASPSPGAPGDARLSLSPPEFRSSPLGSGREQARALARLLRPASPLGLELPGSSCPDGILPVGTEEAAGCVPALAVVRASYRGTLPRLRLRLGPLFGEASWGASSTWEPPDPERELAAGPRAGIHFLLRPGGL